MSADWLLVPWAIVLITLVVGVLVGLWIRRYLRYLRKVAFYRGIIIIAGLLLGIASGSYGHWIQEAGEQASRAFFAKSIDCLYKAVLDITFNGTPTPNDSAWILICRMTGLATTILLSADIIRSFFADSLLDFEMKLRRHHVVVCGLGRIGQAIVRDLLMRSGSHRGLIPKSTVPRGIVAAIEVQDNTKHWRLIEELGAVVLHGNATERSQLSRLNPSRASHVFVVTGTDESNLETLGDLIRIIEEKPLREDLKIFLHCMQPELEQLLWKKPQHLPLTTQRRLQIHGFNATQMVLQSLFDDHVLPRRPISEDQVAHFVIVGFGDMSRALAVHLAQLAHFENLKRSRMTIVHSSRELPLVREFAQLYPAFFRDLAHDGRHGELGSAAVLNEHDTAEGNWHPDEKWDAWENAVVVKSTNQNFPYQKPANLDEVDFETSQGIKFAVNGGFVCCDGGVTSPLFVASIARIISNPNTKTLIFICKSGDEDNTADAYELRDLLREHHAKDQQRDELEPDYTIFPFLPQRPTLHRFINSEQDGEPRVIGWGDCGTVCSFERITNDFTRDLAFQIFRDYQEHHPSEQAIAAASYGELPAIHRQSNWFAAAHFNAKLAAALGLKSEARVLAHIQRHMPQAKRKQIQDLLQQFGPAPMASPEPSSLAEQRSEQRLQRVAQMEHNRWLAERLLRDWKFGDSKRSSSQTTYHGSLLPWSQLPVSEQHKDWRQVIRILKYFLSASG
jgi:hypothetical protein